VKGLLFYYLTSFISVLGVVLGHHFFNRLPHALAKRGDLISSFANWDGEWYQKIILDGYHYNPEAPSDVAIFPGYPLLGKLLVMCTGMRPDLALLIVSHLTLAAAFVVLAAYVGRRFPNAPEDYDQFVLLAFGLLPITFFFRMAYSEALFLLITALALYGMERRWPLLIVAGIIGAATATRAVGVALVPALVLHIWNQSPTGRKGVGESLVFVPIACWGLAGYMAFQWWTFDEPFAFAKTQANWRMRPPVPLEEKIISLAALEPAWTIFEPSSPCNWQKHEPDNNPMFSLHLANPLWFLFGIGLIGLGWYKRWLNSKELILAAGLLLIPYVTKGHEMCMAGMGRFTAVVFPIYLVLGQLLSRIPAPLAAALLAISAFFLGTYAALFASWHRFF